jgi:hypothetical protein
MTGAGSHCGRRLLGKQASMTSTAEVGSQCGRQNSWASELDAARGQVSVVAQGMRRERLKRMTKLRAGGRHVEVKKLPIFDLRDFYFSSLFSLNFLLHQLFLMTWKLI